MHRLDIWNRVELDPIRTEVTRLAYSPNGRLLATGCLTNHLGPSYGIRLWQGKQLVEEYYEAAMRLVWSVDGRLAWGYKDQLNIARPGSDEPVRSWHGSSGELLDLCFSPDGRLLLTGSDSGVCALHDPAECQVRATFDWDIGPIHSVAFSPRRSHLCGGR